MIRGKDDHSQPVNLESFGHIFLRPFHTHKGADDHSDPDGGGNSDADSTYHQYGHWSPSLSAHPVSPLGAGIGAGGGVSSPLSSVLASERASGLKLQEERLQGYQLEGATVEHLVAARCAEGFSVMKISDERNGARGGDRGRGRGLGAQGRLRLSWLYWRGMM